MLYLDVSRMLSRLSSTSPTGIDRVEFEYARYFVNHGLMFVAQDGQDVIQVPRWLAGQVVRHLRSRWNGGEVDVEVITARVATWRKHSKIIRDLSDDEKFFRELYRLKKPRKRLEYLEKERQGVSNYLGRAPIPLPIALWALAIAPGIIAKFVIGRGSEPMPELSISRIAPNITYVNVGHWGLEKTAMLQMLSSAQGVKVAVYLHDLLPLSHPHLFPEKERGRHQIRMENIEKFADMVLANSNFTKEEFESRFKKKKIHSVLEIGAPPLASEKPTAGERQRQGFVSIGTIEPRKNFAWLVKSWIEFCQRRPELVGSERLTIFGKNGWLSSDGHAELVELIDRSQNVEIVNGAGDAVLSARLRSARAYVSASEVEGWGMPLAEALALGTPVIASDIAAHREVTQDKAIYFSIRNEEELHERWSACFDGDRYERLLNAARTFEPWSWESHFARLQSALAS